MGLIGVLAFLAVFAVSLPQPEAATPVPAEAVAQQAVPAAAPTPVPVPLAEPLPAVQDAAAGPPPPVEAQPPADPLAETVVRDDVVVTARDNRGDPAAPLNAASFGATQAVDDALVGPISRAYTSVLPTPVRDGVRNFLGNLREPIVAVNYLLQLKFGKAAETVGRFALNTTVGVAGFVDIAKRKPFGLRRRRNSFANTLALYGVGPGPFFFLPLIGPTTLRDLLGSGIDQVMVPISAVPPLNDPTAALVIGGFSLVSYRADIDPELKDIRAAPDPYAERRRTYLERRQAEIDAIRGRKRAANTPPPAPPLPVPTPLR